ncbi:amino acid adenylation domain-containing protein [Streptomyces sp. NBC_00878]|uniref:amino acid adenylation domain-containing protein n=1 Tax=Streptomyces sp. NBC_00878 TaxID=2975854 RepID=UPI002259F000|nr:amino acid adenylation domain-containing protein [Streptomyces sp. NBC_00878]MCX4911791.1 amino acid adenylation domain-containing protein [Streptomyces sp. NBC_00878]
MEETAAARLRRLRRGGGSGIRPVGRDGPLPLSFAQRRLWFLDQLDPAGSAYTIPFAQRLRGPLDPHRLASALTEVVRRHESLRTVFTAGDDTPAQKILDPFPVDVPVLDADLEQARELVRAEFASPFDLADGPLLRALVVRLAPDDHVFALSLHHICGDAWSHGVLLREISARYAGYDLPRLPVQYADFAAWERGLPLRTRLRWWEEQLRGAPAVLELPADRPRPATATSDAGRVRWDIPADLADATRALARSHGATLYMALLAVLHIVLGRYARTTDVPVGTPVANRNRAELEGLIGLFVNTVVLRGDLSGDPSFAELLTRTRDTALDAFAHGDVPFDYLTERLAPDRDLATNPLVQVLFQVLDGTAATAALPGVTAATFETGHFDTRMDLEVHVFEQPDGLSGHLLFNHALFDGERIERLARHLTVVLRAVVADPALRLSQVPLLDEAELRQVTAGFNDTAREMTARSLPAMLADRARRHPDRLAVEDDMVSLTYAELHRRANRIAHRLIALGVGTGELVGLCLDRGADLIVAMVGILNAGAAYVPIDPEHPAERVRFVLEDTRLRTVVTQAEHRPLFGGVEHVVEAPFDDEPGVIAPDVDPGPEDLAYAIYTSGSTGRPKAVLMPHAGPVNLLLWQERTMPHEPESRTLQFVSATFDYSVQEILSTLMGGTLVVPPDGVRLDLAGLAAWMDEHRITRIFAPTTVLRGLLEHVDPAGPLLHGLRRLCQGGEALVLDERLRSFCRHRPRVRVHNHYGPAETQLVTGWRLPERVDDWPGTASPLGPPIDNIRLYVLDDALRPVPIGVPGQLCISGVGVSRGYLGRPGMTAQRLVNAPVEPEGRTYLSGDLCRWTVDGNLEFLGRIDHQVKIRGVRVEPGEVETVLAGHPAVTQTVVVAREDRPAGRRLVAYVVAPGAGTELDAELRRLAESRLPAPAVPALFVVLPELPRNTSGKVDRHALPAPGRRTVPTAGAPPRDATEAAVCRIFAEALDLPGVGIHDDFFALGGHSLLATRITSRLRAELGVDVPLRELFQGRTPETLARAVHGASRAVPLTARSRDATAPLSLAQEQMLLWYGSLLDASTWSIPLAYRLRGPLDVPALERALTAVVARHEALRTGFTPDGGTVVRAPSAVPVPVDDATPDDVPRLTREEVARPFDLARDVLVRPHLWRLGTDDHLLLLTSHHLASDGWSLRVLADEVSLLYAGAAPPPLAVQYADHALWERDRPLATEHAYWRERLAGYRPLELPAGRPRRPGPAATLRWTLPAPAADAARKLARTERATLYETLLTAFCTVAAGLTGNRDVTVAAPFANRSRAETEPLIGYFAKIIALRTDLSGEPGFREALRRVHATMVAAHAHQDLPFYHALAPGPPPLNVSFQLISALQPVLDLPGVTASPVDVSVDQTVDMPSELAVHLIESADGALSGLASYNAATFDRATIEALLAAVGDVLDRAMDDPDRTIGDLAAGVLDRGTAAYEARGTS